MNCKKMDTVISDDSSDVELMNMKNQLSEYGLYEDNLSKHEMSDLLKALNNSKSSAKEEALLQSKSEESPISPTKALKRRFINVRDRRLPWSLLPNTLTQAEKARALAVYIKLMSINNYWQARQSLNFMVWPPPIQIMEESARIQPIRSTRSGRSVPIYEAFDDDSSDLDFVVTKPKKRKISNSENSNTVTNKVLSLKRKPSKDEISRPTKELKITEINIQDTGTVNEKIKIIHTEIED